MSVRFLPLLQIDIRPVGRQLILLGIAFPRLIRLLMRGPVVLLPRIVVRRLAGIFFIRGLFVHVGQRGRGNRVPKIETILLAGCSVGMTKAYAFSAFALAAVVTVSLWVGLSGVQTARNLTAEEAGAVTIGRAK